jgi:hypothetical protein
MRKISFSFLSVCGPYCSERKEDYLYGDFLKHQRTGSLRKLDFSKA